MQHAIAIRVIGFIGSLILTLLAYYVILHPDFFSFNFHTASSIIFGLALIQSLIQLICFIDVWQEKGPRWNLAIFISTVSIMFVVIFFSIWIMDHLNYNMVF